MMLVLFSFLFGEKKDPGYCWVKKPRVKKIYKKVCEWAQKYLPPAGEKKLLNTLIYRLCNHHHLLLPWLRPTRHALSRLPRSLWFPKPRSSWLPVTFPRLDLLISQSAVGSALAATQWWASYCGVAEEKIFKRASGPRKKIGGGDFNPLPYEIFRGAQPMACGLFGPTEMTTLSVLKTILMM